MDKVEVQSIRLGETELHYTENGTGLPVILVHGGFADYRLWGNLSSVLSPSFKVVSYSRRGAFPNARSKEGSTIELHSRDLSSLISRFSDRPVHLVGESIGAYVALHCAIHHPDQVRSLTIDEPPILRILSGKGDEFEEIERFQEVLDLSLDFYSAGRTEEATRAIIDYLEGSTGVYDSLPKEAKEVIAANSPPTLEDLKKGLDGIATNDLKLLRAPALLLKSTQGPKLLKLVVAQLHESIPTSRLREIGGTSHGTIVDSQEYCSAVLEFLRAN